MRINRRNTTIFLLWMELLMLPGCKCRSSSGSNISNIQVHLYPTDIPGSGSIYLSEYESKKGSITIGINAKEVEEINSVYFDLVYNPSVINYSSSEEGDFFNSDGQITSNFIVELQNETEGRIYVGINRLNNSAVKGSGLIGKITFIPVADDNTSITFENNKLYRYNSSSSELSEVTAVWFGGTINR